MSPSPSSSTLDTAVRVAPQPLERDAETDVLVMGAGLAGLTAAAVAARAGARVMVLDARREVGGRARSEQVDGFTVNEGSHALYRTGPASTVLRDLGIVPQGRIPTQRGGAWLVGDQLVPWRRTSAIGGMAAGLRTARALTSARLARGAEGRSLTDWLDEHVPDEARPLAEMLVRTTTYTADLASLDAAAALAQMRLGARGVKYLHGGWQSIVNALRHRAIHLGADLYLGKAEHLEQVSDGLVVATSDGASVEARAVISATGGPTQLDSMLGGGSATAARWSEQARPIRAACLDVGLSTLPRPARTSTYALDRPLYLVDHAATARIAPDGGGVFHGLWYEPDLTSGVDPIAELERAMDVTQPGWRDQVIVERRRQQVVVAHDRLRSESPGALRPRVKVGDLESVYVAGDWVAGHGALADAAVGTGHEAGMAAAEAVRANPRRHRRPAGAS